MKLSEKHIQQIERLLDKSDIFYDDIRHEMTDHVATALEEDTDVTPENFELKLSAYYNSHLWVKLLSAAQAQEKIRDRQYKGYFFNRFVTVRGIVLYVLMLAAVYLAEYNIYAKRVVEVLFLLCIVSLWVGPLKKKWPFANRMIGVLGLYYAPLVLLTTQLRRFFDEETPVLMAIRLICIALIFTGHIILYKTNRHYKNQRYA